MKENQHSHSLENGEGFPPLFERARRSAVILLRIEAALLAGIVLYLIGAAILKGVEAPGALAGVILFATSGAVGLYFCSRGFAQRQSYGRAPALLANLIALGVSYFMISGHLIWVGTVLALLATVTALSSLFGYTE